MDRLGLRERCYTPAPTASPCRPTANLFSGKPSGNDAGIASAMAVAIPLILSLCLDSKAEACRIWIDYTCTVLLLCLDSKAEACRIQ